jgi:hypothetical protein
MIKALRKLGIEGKYPQQERRTRDTPAVMSTTRHLINKGTPMPFLVKAFSQQSLHTNWG